MGARRVDAAILGGGPAGCATALCLRALFPSLEVLLVEASAYEEPRLGEVLPAAARAVLEQLGVAGVLGQEPLEPVYAAAAAWGSPRLEENHFLFSAQGHGWHLDRARFDALLCRQAEQRGASVLRATRCVRAERAAEGFQLTLSNEEQVSARFVVDATGRRAAFARTQGARPREVDRLCGFARMYPAAVGSEPRTLIEAFGDGWWYTALLPGGARVVACMTDVDVGRELGLLEPERFERLLRETRWVSEAVGEKATPRVCLVRPASSGLLRPVCGEGWLAVGDTAATFDPLSAQGMTKALRSGVVAAYAAADLLLKQERSGLRRYEALHQRELLGYRRALSLYYAQEQRWASRPFWRRRHGPGGGAGSPLYQWPQGFLPDP